MLARVCRAPPADTHVSSLVCLGSCPSHAIMPARFSFLSLVFRSFLSISISCMSIASCTVSFISLVPCVIPPYWVLTPDYMLLRSITSVVVQHPPRLLNLHTNSRSAFYTTLVYVEVVLLLVFAIHRTEVSSRTLCCPRAPLSQFRSMALCSYLTTPRHPPISLIHHLPSALP